MIKQKVLEAYEEMAEAYDRLIDTKPHNAEYDRPNTLALMENVSGKKVLDAACGPGKYAEELIAKGAEVTGFDLSPKMIELAKARNGSKGSFYVGDLTQPIASGDEEFDFVLCALAMHYLEDWKAIFREFHRVLKPDGQLVISIEHPFFNFLYFKSENYFELEQVEAMWTGFGTRTLVHSYRRSLGSVMSAITESGFYIDKFVEPKPTEVFKKLDPRHYEELNKFPSFLCLRAVKR